MTVPLDPMVFLLLALVILTSAVAAVTLRNLVHCALSLTVTFAGLACIYLQLHAQFVGFAQILVYIGAVAILIVFAILLTRGREPETQAIFSSSWWAGVGVTVAVFGVLAGIILSSRALGSRGGTVPEAPVRQIGEQLMTRYVLPLEVLGLLLTAALLGAVVIAMRDGEKAGGQPSRAGGLLSAAARGAGAGHGRHAAAQPDSTHRTPPGSNEL